MAVRAGPAGAGDGAAAGAGSPYGGSYEQAAQPEDGEDRNSKINLTFRQSVKGATVSLSADGKKFKTHVPAGVRDGQKIRISGKGKPGRNGGKNGDLYLQISVVEDPKNSACASVTSSWICQSPSVRLWRARK